MGGESRDGAVRRLLEAAQNGIAVQLLWEGLSKGEEGSQRIYMNGAVYFVEAKLLPEPHVIVRCPRQ